MWTNGLIPFFGVFGCAGRYLRPSLFRSARIERYMRVVVDPQGHTASVRTSEVT